MSFSFSADDLSTALACVDTKALVTIDPAEYTAFGLMNSHLYRARFLDIVSKNALSTMEITMVIILCTAVRNKKRIFTAMARFSSAAWYMKVRNFIINKMVQYTSELDTTNTKFAVVHVPSSFWVNLF
jgi:hypothetical protein